MTELLSHFRRFTEAEAWPEEIQHLRGKVLIRKKDGAEYRIAKPVGQTFGAKPSAYLAPVGNSWPIVSRSHWKTHVKILTDFTVKE